MELPAFCNLPILITTEVEPYSQLSKINETTMMTNWRKLYFTLQWRHNERDGVSDHQPHDCLLNCLFRRRLKKTWKLRVSGICAGNSPVTGKFPAQRASNAENVSIWWRHHAIVLAKKNTTKSNKWLNTLYKQRARLAVYFLLYILYNVFFFTTY